jgi:hypothetical protein
MSSVWVDFLIGTLLLGAGVVLLVLTHRFIAKAPASSDDYFVPAMAGTLITSLLACGVAFVIEAALLGHMVREVAIAVPIGIALLVLARFVRRLGV